MAKFICLQAGHEGRTSGATGAPGEIELNVRIRNRLSQILIERGFMIQLVGADPPKAEYYKDFDLFLALHGDADIYGTGGGVVACIAPPPFDSSEESNAESRRIRDTIASIYFKETGIVNHPERSNKNMTEYYMWSKLTPKTPCVIIEMGVVQDAHDKVLLGNTELIASALGRAICQAFSVNYDLTPPEITCEERLTNANKEIDTLRKLSSNLSVQITNLNGKLEEEQKLNSTWQKRLETANKEIKKIEAQLTNLSKDRNQYKNWYEDAKRELRYLDKMTGWEHIQYGIKLLIKKENG